MKKSISLLAFCLYLSGVSAQGELSLSPGIQWVSNGNVQLVLQDTRMTINGDFLPSQSRISIYGIGSPFQSAITGSKPLNFYDLKLNHSGGGMLLEQHIQLSNELIFTSGKLNLNGYDLVLGETGFLSGESENSRIIGTQGGEIHAFAYLDAPYQINPGNLGLEISSHNNLDTIHLSRGHKKRLIQGPITGYADSSIARYFQVSPPQDQMEATLGFYYFDGELGVIEESGLDMGRYSAQSQSWWSAGMPTGPLDTFLNRVEKTLIDSSGLFTLAHISILAGIEDEPSRLNTWIVYPNPTAGELIIEWELVRRSSVEMKLTDLRGREVYLKRFPKLNGTQRLKLDLNHLAEGVYNLILHIDGKPYYKKIMVF